MLSSYLLAFVDDVTEQQTNMDIIATVLRKPYSEIHSEFTPHAIRKFLLEPHCAAIVVGYDVLHTLCNDYFFFSYYAPLRESEAERFVAGRFMGVLVLSNYSVPKGVFAKINVTPDLKSSIERFVFV